MNTEIKGRGGISAKIIADSIAPNGARITTYELEYPRFIHSEFMTHRLFSRNAASSRAIPVTKQIENIKANTAMPIHWGKNQPGMSAKEECDTIVEWPSMWPVTFAGPSGTPLTLNPMAKREKAWQVARDNAILMAEAFNAAGYHKQIVNRLLEPFTFIKVVCTATEYDNFFNLRCHPDAQPEIQELAGCMWDARNTNVPVVLGPLDWHTPYYENGFWTSNGISVELDVVDKHGRTKEDALMVSASQCAQVSYRKSDDSLEKAKDIYKRLVESKPMHASPFEHQATPIEYGDPNLKHDVQEGITHYTVIGAGHELEGVPVDAWSGNLRGWIQHRQLIKNNTCWSYNV